MKWSEVLITQSCLILCEPMDCSPPGSSVHGNLQARILASAAFSFSRRSSRPRDRACVSCMAGRFLTDWATRNQCFSMYRQIQEPGLVEIIPLACFSALRGKHPALSHPERLTLSGCMQQLTPRWWAFFVSILSSLWAHHQGRYNVVTWWKWHPLLTDMADSILSSHSHTWRRILS